MTRPTWLLAMLSLAAAAAQQPVETAVYQSGAWHVEGDEASLALYQRAGMNLIGHRSNYADWAAERDLQFIAAVSSRGLPREVARPFEANDGTQSASVGLFTAINFNAPSVEAWWREAVPRQVAEIAHGERVAWWKVHNEFGYHAGKVWDYSPGSLARYRAWLEATHGDLATLNRRWGSQHTSFATIEPPRELPVPDAKLGNWLDWRRFTCWNFGDYFRTTGDLIRATHPNAKVSDNFYPTSPMVGWDLFELARLTDYMALDIYAIGRWDRLISGLDRGRTAAAAWGKPFLMMEYHAGPNDWAPVVRAEDLYIEAYLALARECRAIQWYHWRPGATGREQGIHGIVDSSGRPTERLTAVRDTAEKTSRLAPLLARQHQEPQVAILTSADTCYLNYARRQDSWAGENTWDSLGRLLDDTGIGQTRYDGPSLLAADLRGLKAIIVAALPVLDVAVTARLRDFAAGGGTVIVHPDCGTLDGWARPPGEPRYAFDAETGQDGPWPLRRPSGAAGPVAVESVGAGRLVRCGWVPPIRLPEDAVRQALADSYAALLAELAGVGPDLTVSCAEPVAIDADLLRAGDLSLVYLTALRHEPAEAVTVTVPADRVSADQVLVIQPRTTRVDRLAVRYSAAGASFTLPRLDPAALVLLPGAWQPLVGIDSPARMTAGGRYPVTVTVDNLDPAAVAGSVALHVPAGWTAVPRGAVAFASLAPGGRAEVTYDVSLPAELPDDRFGLDYPLTATVTFTAGRAGELTATALPLVVPRLDLLVHYREVLVNPWQEMAPPILRWGYDREVKVPPPPAVAIRAATPVRLELTADPSLAGQTAELRLDGGEVSPSQVRLAAGLNVVEATLRLAAPGEAGLEASVPGATARATFAADVNAETLLAAAATSPPPVPTGWRRLATLAAGSQGPSLWGEPVRFPVTLTSAQAQRALVIDPQGQPQPAAIGAHQVTLAAATDASGVALYSLAEPPGEEPRPAPLARLLPPTDEAELLVQVGDYQVSFDEQLALVRGLTIAGEPVLTERTGVVAHAADGSAWAPDGRIGTADAALAVSHTPVTVTVDFSRRIGPDGQLLVTEQWAMAPARIAVTVRVENTARTQLTFQRLEYELGVDPARVTGWQAESRTGATQRGALPTGFGLPAPLAFAGFNGPGAGLGLRFGRCALASKWQNGWSTLRHGPGRTSIGLFGQIALDPGDWVLAEFELFCRAGEVTAAGTAAGQPVTAVLAAE